MLAKCVNPSCDNRFKHLREGRLLRVERRTSPSRRKSSASRETEYYWLCGPCSASLNLAFDGEAGIVLIPMASPQLVASSPVPIHSPGSTARRNLLHPAI